MAKLDSPLAPDWTRQHIGIVLAAARAYACEDCDGTGVDVPQQDVCSTCKEDRELADKGATNDNQTVE